MRIMIQLPYYRLAGVAALLTATLLISACGGGGGGKKPTGGASSLTGNSSLDNLSSKNNVSSRSNSSIGGGNGSTGSSLASTASSLDPAIISRENEGGNAAPIVAIDSAGNAITVWIVEDPSTSPTSYELLARRFVLTSGWQAIEVVAAKTKTHYIETPALTIDKTTGKAMVIWETHDRATTTSDVIARAYDPVTGWGTPIPIDDTMPGLNSSPVADTDSNGNVMVVWNRRESLTNKLYAALYSSNGVWGSSIRIEDNNEIGGGGSGARVAFLANGDALVVWNSSRPGTTNNIWGNKYTKGTGWGTNAIVEASINNNSDPLRLVDSPSIAADAKSNAILTYSRQQYIPATFNYQLNVVAKRYASGSWSTDITAIGEPLTCLNCPRSPDSLVRVTAQGLAVATWVLDSSSGVDTVWASRTRSDGVWESKTFSADASQFIDSSGRPDAGIDDAGNVSLVWSLTGSGETNIYSARYKAGTGWGTAELFESDKGTADYARIAMNGNGNAMTVWLQFNSSLGTVVASKYFKP
jgi:hypothetical protein